MNRVEEKDEGGESIEWMAGDKEGWWRYSHVNNL